MLILLVAFLVFVLKDCFCPGGETIAAMMGLGGWVIAAFAVMFLFYTNSFLMRRRKKEFGLYNILGQII